MKDYYDILNVPRDASQEDIKRLYRLLAHQFHPDKNDGNDRRFKEINEAYRVLSGTSSKTDYDRQYDVGLHRQKTGTNSSHTSVPNQSTKPGFQVGQFIANGGWFLILLVLGIWSSFSSGSSTDTTQASIPDGASSYAQSTIYKPISPVTIKAVPDCGADEVLNSSKTACITHDAKCTSQWSNSVWDGSKCTCSGDYEWNPSETACVTPYAYCPEKYSGSIYSANTNSCVCPSGDVWNSNTTACVDPLEARNDSCNATYPNSEYLKPNPSTGGYTCDCKTGYYWNIQRTACYSDTQMTQSCVNSYGTGSSYQSPSYGNSGGCDCSYGYSWNNTRTSCVTTASINQICEFSVGRNSYYLGTISADGKYNCSNPY